jgi:hypothetical protein
MSHDRDSNGSQKTPYGKTHNKKPKPAADEGVMPAAAASADDEGMPDDDEGVMSAAADKGVMPADDEGVMSAAAADEGVMSDAKEKEIFDNPFYLNSNNRYLKSCNPEQHNELIEDSQIVINEKQLEGILSDKIQTLEKEAGSEEKAFSLDAPFLYRAEHELQHYEKLCNIELRELQKLLNDNGFRIIMMHDIKNGHIFFYLMHEVYDYDTNSLVEKLVGKLEWTISFVYASILKGRITHRGITPETKIPVCHISWVGSYANGMKLAVAMERIAMFYSFLYAGVKTGHKENATSKIFTEFDYNNWDLLFFPLELAFSDYSSEGVSSQGSSLVSSQGSSQDSSQDSFDSQKLSDHESDEGLVESEEPPQLKQILSGVPKELIYYYYSPQIKLVFEKHKPEIILTIMDKSNRSKDENAQLGDYKKMIDVIIKDKRYFEDFLGFVLKDNEEYTQEDIVAFTGQLKDDIKTALEEFLDHTFLERTFFIHEGDKLHFEIAEDVHVCNILELLGRDATPWDKEGNTYFKIYTKGFRKRMAKHLPQLTQSSVKMASSSSTVGGSSIMRNKITYKTKKNKQTKRNKGRTKRTKRNKGRTKRRKN